MKTVALLLPFALLQPSAEPSLEQLLDRLSAYLTQYEPLISEVIADEVMTQRDRFAARSRYGVSRRLKSEVAFMRLPGGGEWMGFRLVHEVNRRPVSDQQTRLQQLLSATGDEYRRGIAIARESARHNLGVSRTTNVPLLAFHLLHPRNRGRFTYEKHGLERVTGRQLRRIDFTERVVPTIIQTSLGGDVPSRGSIWLDEATGAVYETVVVDRDGGPARLEVTFTMDNTLGILVPQRMREVFPLSGAVGEGDARYSNFRRFTTSARIVPQ
jgi:hypothetical protein